MQSWVVSLIHSFSYYSWQILIKLVFNIFSRLFLLTLLQTALDKTFHLTTELSFLPLLFCRGQFLLVDSDTPSRHSLILGPRTSAKSIPYYSRTSVTRTSVNEKQFKLTGEFELSGSIEYPASYVNN